MSPRCRLTTAVDGGYKIHLIGDGIADVTKQDGAIYHVDLSNGGCDCPDALKRNGGSYRGHCKHSWWVAQVSPCANCGGVMILNNKMRIFECGDCGDAKALGLVKEERALRRDELQRAQSCVETR